ncbi:N-acetylmuramoyl-L-alanine amidase [hydrothermal vent metagenome]|uniref:N-acetylmuramoyl-L-alanine amidase n=1 Tax=hydrothermal vent metagenome TaxID=652676 RepID=A0A3B0RHC6_9ZZZZ
MQSKNQKTTLFRITLLALLWLTGGLFGADLTVPKALAAPDKLPEISKARIDSNAEKTRFTAELNFAIGYNVYVLTNPYRVIIDIPDAIFNLPVNAGEVGRGLISNFRFGQLDDNRSRIVIDVTGPVLIQNSYAVRAKKDRPARLIIDLIATDEETFAKINQADQVTNLVAKEQAKTEQSDGIIPEDHPLISDDRQSSDPIADLLRGKGLIAKKQPRQKTRQDLQITQPQASAPSRSKKLLIVIDPGHGGIDTGTTSKSGKSEKAVVLAFSKKLRARLKSLGRYDVIMTRSDDTFVRLRKRVSIAHKNKADLFIAIHADSIKFSAVRGTTIYTLSETASDAEAAALAAKENQSDIIAGVDLAGETKEISNILIDLAQRETKNLSLYFAKKAISSLKRVTRVAKRPMRAAGFVVLKAPDVPSVLLELGYLSNKSDAKLLTSKAWQKKVAKALAQSIDNYFRARVALQ